MMEVAYPVMERSFETSVSGKSQSMTEGLDRLTGNSTIQTDLDVIDPNTALFFRHLMRKYRKQMGDSNTRVCSGGIQQYLNKHTEKDGRAVASGQEQSPFENLPVNVRLHIYSFLTAKELCYVSQVCRSWYDLTQDNLLWQDLLKRDVHKWHVIGHNTNPSMYREVQSDWLNKDIYLRCSPEVNKLMHQQNTVFHSISSMLRYFMPRKCPKFAMFGPGLETSTRSLVRKLMYEDTQKFHRIGMFPGQFEGVGGGMTLKTESGHQFQLAVLYASTKQERERSQQNRTQRNRLLQENKGEAAPEKYELMTAVRDLCRTLDGFIYVADATQDSHAVESGADELVAMVSERWSATHVPVLVLSCVQTSSTARLPCMEVVERLELAKLNRPWQVQDCVSESLEGVVDSLTWLVEQSQRR